MQENDDHYLGDSPRLLGLLFLGGFILAAGIVVALAYIVTKWFT